VLYYMLMIGLSELLSKGVFVIAEIGCNFEGDFDRAKEMVIAAAEAGANAVKFQTFIPENIASRHAEKFWDIGGCPGETQLEEFQLTPRLSTRQYRELLVLTRRLGIVCFSTPSDEVSVQVLEKLQMPLYKISSMDITHFPLLQSVAKTGKPIILSTGASTIGEIEEAIKAIHQTGNMQIALLHCISNYPTKDQDANLRMILSLKTNFPEIPIGYSDHTRPSEGEGIITAAVALGARIIEKHYTFDSTRPGYDHEISVDYEGLKRLVHQVRRVEKALGKNHKEPVASELKARIHARRSLVASIDIPVGTEINQDMIAVKRPGTGIEPRFFNVVLGRRAQQHIAADTVLQWSMV
jgi:sialic acid synthase SpsE